MRYPYNWIITMFKLNLIYPASVPLFNKPRRKCHECVLTMLNVLISLLYVVPEIYTTYTHTSYMMMFANTIVITITVIYRWSLCIKFNQIIEIAYHLNNRKTSYHLRKISWIHVYVILNFLSQIVLLACYILTFMHEFNNLDFGYALNPIDYDILGTAYAVHAVFFFTTPINIFSIFYVAVCQQVKLEILHFLKVMSSHPSLGYEVILRLYTNLASKVESIDSKLSFMLLLNTIFSIINMYFLIFNLLHSDGYGTFLDILSLCFFINMFLSFISMNVSASSVSDASGKIVAKARALSSDSVHAALVLQRFLFHADKGISMTLWGMVPIRKHFIVGIIGATFTYAVLFDSLKL